MYQTFFKVYEFDGEEMAVEELVSRDFGIIHYLSPLAISIILTTYENLSLKIANKLSKSIDWQCVTSNYLFFL